MDVYPFQKEAWKIRMKFRSAWNAESTQVFALSPYTFICGMSLVNILLTTKMKLTFSKVTEKSKAHRPRLDHKPYGPKIT